jgi:hypothetical protein
MVKAMEFLKYHIIKILEIYLSWVSKPYIGVKTHFSRLFNPKDAMPALIDVSYRLYFVSPEDSGV